MAVKSLDEEALFHAARRIASADDRSQFLRHACGDDAGLAERVLALLAMHEQNPSEPEEPGEQTRQYEALDERAGSRVGPYTLREQIGEGGFGLVFVAEQQQPVRRKVALKVIKPGMDTRAVVARFEAERQALAMMDHPHIAKVYDAGTTDTGRPYFVMELVKGMPITEYADANNLPPRERLELFVQVCQAVQHAHQKGVIHRDLKPSNILVAPHDGIPVVKVIDFGIAKALGQSLTEKTIYTRYAQMIGTPLYMSPEQAEVNQLDVDTRSDVYSLGVLLYELLTGTTPFDGDRFRKAAFDEIRRIIKEEEPPRPSTRLTSLGATLTAVSAKRGTDPSRMAGLVRGELDWIVMRCLEKDRSHRYDTAVGLAKDVQRYLSGDAVEACPPTLGYRLRKAYRRNRGAVLVGGTIAAVLLLATGVSLAFGIVAKQAEHRADASATDAIESERIAQQRLRDVNAAQAALASEEHKRVRLEYARGIQLADATLRLERFDVALRVLDEARPELRGWEWHFLNRLKSNDCLTELRPDPAKIVHAAYSPNGRQILTSSYVSGKPNNLIVQVWNAESRVLQFTLPNDNDRRGSSQFSRDGKKILVVQDRSVTVWDVASQIAEPPLVPEEGMTFYAAAFGPDGARIVTSSYRPWIQDSAEPRMASVTLWDAKNRKQIWSKKWPDGVGIANLSNPNGKWVVATCRVKGQPSDTRRADEFFRYELKVWDADTGDEILTLPFQDDADFAQEFSPTGDRIASAHSDGTVKLWPIKQVSNRLARDGEPVTLRTNWPRIAKFAFSPDGTRIVTGTADGMARIWDAATGTVIRSFRADSRLVLSVEFSPDGQRVITVGSGTAKVWDVNNKNELSAFPHAQILSARFSQTGDRVLTSPGFGETRVWDVQTGKKLATLEGGCYFNVQTTSPDDRWIATNPNGTVRIYDAKTFGLKHVLKEDSWIRMASFSPDGTQLLTTAEGLTTTVWDVVNGVVLDKIAAKSDQRGWVGAGFSPNGKQFFVERLGTDSNSLKGITIYDATTRKPRIELRLEGTNLDLNPDGSLGYFLWEGAFSPDGKRFVGNFSFRGSARNNKCLVWNVDTGKIELSFSTHSGTNYSVAFSLDGKRIVTGGSGVAKVWDAESGLELLAIPTGGPVGSVAFNRDGTKLIIANGSEARIFDGTPLPEPKK